MQRAAWSIGLVLMSLGTSACMDQGARDRALVEMEAARWQASHDARLQTLEREHAFLMQQFANLVASTNAATLQSSGREDERDKRLSEISGQLVTITSMISTWREEERPKPVDPDARRIGCYESVRSCPGQTRRACASTTCAASTAPASPIEASGGSTGILN